MPDVSGQSAQPGESDSHCPGKGSVAPHSYPLHRNCNFLTVWVGQACSNVGDTFALIAMPLLVLQATGSIVQMGLVTATFAGAQVAVGLFAGAIADRLDRRWLMIGCDAGRTLAYAAIPLGWLLLGPQPWLIYVVTAIGGALGMLFNVAYAALLTVMVEKDQLTAANGWLQSTFGVALLIGPALAGVTADRFGPAWALLADSASFAASVASVALVRVRKLRIPVASVESAADADMGLFARLVAGVRFLYTNPVLRWLTVVIIVYNFVSASGLDLFVYYIKHDLGYPDTALGMVFATSSVGGILGGLLAAPLRRHMGFARTYVGAIIVSAIPLALIGLAMSVPLIAALAGLFQVGSVVMSVNSLSLRQQMTPDHLQGRVTSAAWTLFTVAMPLGSAAGTALAARLGVPLVFAMMGACCLSTALVAIFTPLGRATACARPNIEPH
jgi:MFS family permease